MEWDSWQPMWEAATAACTKMGGDVRPVEIQPPATEAEVMEVERALERRLPAAFRTVLTTFSKKVSFCWYLPDDTRPPEPLNGIFSGGCEWDLARLALYEKRRQSWASSCCPNPDDAHDRVWYDKLPFLPVPNGDFLAVDLATGDRSPVVYLSHEDGEGHGFELGADFVDFVNKWSRIGCPGAEDWQWLPFTSDARSLLDPDCANARQWREWFGMQLPHT